MADLLVNLKLDGKEFNTAISQSTNQIRQFKQDSEKAGTSVNSFGGKLQSMAIGGIAKFAGAVGAAYSATEIFNGIMQSTNSTSETLETAIYQAKTAVDYFFTSIATGDWSNFFTGIINATNLAKEFRNIINELEDKKEGRRWLEPEEKLEFDRNRTIIMDPKSTPEQRKKALEDNKNIVKIWEDRANSAKELNTNAISKKVQEIINKYGVSLIADLAKDIEGYDPNEDIYNAIADIIFRFKNDPYGIEVGGVNVGEYVAKKKELQDAFDEANVYAIKGDPKAKTSIDKARSRSFWRDESKRRKKAIDDFNNANKDNKVIQIIEEIIDLENLFTKENVDILLNLKNDAVEQLSNIESFKRLDFKLANKTNTTTGTGNGSTTVKDIAPEGSLKDLKNQINDLNKQIELEIDPIKRAALYKQIQELEKKVVTIEVAYKLEDVGTVAQEWISNRVTPEEVLNKAKNYQINIPELPEITKEDPFEAYRNALQKAREENEATIESFDAVSNALSAIGDASNGSAADWFKYLASVTSSVGQAIPIIEALIMTRKAEANANAEAAATGAAASVAGIPIVGALLAVSAVATVLASLASIPKFAEGGLVYGNTIAQVGEYAGASSNPEVIAPLSKLRDILADTNNGIGSGTVDFRISGKDLVGVISNYSHKNSKK